MTSELSPREKIRQILFREVRPHLNDPHARRQQRFRIYEKILVRLLQSSPGDEMDVLWSMMRQAADQEPWRAALQRSLQEAGAHYLVKQQSGDGQMRWDLSSEIEKSVGETDDYPTTYIQTIQALLKHRPIAESAEEKNRIKLSFLTELYLRLQPADK